MKFSFKQIKVFTFTLTHQNTFRVSSRSKTYAQGPSIVYLQLSYVFFWWYVAVSICVLAPLVKE